MTDKTVLIRVEKAFDLGLNLQEISNLPWKDFKKTFNITSNKKASVLGQQRNIINALKSKNVKKDLIDIKLKKVQKQGFTKAEASKIVLPKTEKIYKTRKTPTKSFRKIYHLKTYKNKYSGVEIDIYTSFYKKCNSLTQSWNLKTLKKQPKAYQHVILRVQFEVFEVLTNNQGKKALGKSLGINWMSFKSITSKQTTLLNLYDSCVSEMEFYMNSKKSVAFIIVKSELLIFREGYLK